MTREEVLQLVSQADKDLRGCFYTVVEQHTRYKGVLLPGDWEFAYTNAVQMTASHHEAMRQYRNEQI